MKTEIQFEVLKRKNGGVLFRFASPAPTDYYLARPLFCDGGPSTNFNHMLPIVHLQNYGALSLQEGLPSAFAAMRLPGAVPFHAVGPWGMLVVQEMGTAKFQLCHFLFSLKETIHFFLADNSPSLQSLLGLKGRFTHSLGGVGAGLQEKEFLVFKCKPSEALTSIEEQPQSSLLYTAYTPSLFSDFLPLFTNMKTDLESALRKPRYLSFPQPAPYQVLDIIETLFVAHYKPPVQEKHAELRIKIALLALLSQAYAPVAATSISAMEKEKAAAAKSLLLADLKIHRTTREVAQSLHCSQAWLQRAFRKVYGMGLFHFLRKERMIHARRQLLKGESLKVVAMEVGMKPRNFPKEFKAFFGYTVTALKRSNPS